MNKKQRLVLAIFVPIIIFFIALTIANDVGYTVKTREVSENSYTKSYGISSYHEDNPFDWGRTWHIWFLSLILCFIFEYKLFGDKKKKDKGNLNE